MNADCEVKKLKDLVKKLERQNQHLRYKTGKLGNQPRNLDLPRNSSTSTKYDATLNEPVISTQNHLPINFLEESCLEKLQGASETSWLYSELGEDVGEDRFTLELWLRRELEHPPTHGLATAKKDIISSLNIIHCSEEPSVELYTLPCHQDTLAVHHTFEDSVPSEAQKVVIAENVHSLHLPNHSKATAHGGMPRNQRGQSPTRSARSHMPLPSHTMTSAHGLISNESARERNIRDTATETHMPLSGLNATLTPSTHSSITHEGHKQRTPSPTRNPESPLFGIKDTSARRAQSKSWMRYKSPRARGIPTPSSSRLETNRGRTYDPKIVDTRNDDTVAILPSYTADDNDPEIRSSYGLKSEHGNSPGQKRNLHSYSKSLNTSASGRNVKHLQSSQLKDTSLDGFDSGPVHDAKTRNQVFRRSLPRPSRLPRNGEVGAKTIPCGVNRGMQNYPTDDSKSDGSGSQTSDVWKDGEFF